MKKTSYILIFLIGFVLITAILGFVITKWFFALSGTALIFFLFGNYFTKNEGSIDSTTNDLNI